MSAAPTRRWLSFALATTLLWGAWGALIELPEKAGFPATLGYTVWSLTMVPCALVALGLSHFTLTWRLVPVLLAAAAGLLGAGGQLLLFEALRDGPAFIVFPMVSLYPGVTIVCCVLLLGERARPRQWSGIALALVAVPLLSYVPPGDSIVRGTLWAVLALAVLVMWGVQGYMIKLVNERMSSENIFFLMMLTGVALAPIAVAMTDFSRPIEWGLRGPWAAAAIHILNAVGALTLVYALREGKAVIVVPMTALAPVITVVLSLAIYQRLPAPAHAVGLLLALCAIYLMAE